VAQQPCNLRYLSQPTPAIALASSTALKVEGASYLTDFQFSSQSIKALFRAMLQGIYFTLVLSALFFGGYLSAEAAINSVLDAIPLDAVHGSEVTSRWPIMLNIWTENERTHRS
jgi:hypothetical protein